jgi:hypothetical protein
MRVLVGREGGCSCNHGVLSRVSVVATSHTVYTVTTVCSPHPSCDAAERIVHHMLCRRRVGAQPAAVLVCVLWEQ